MGKAAYAPPEGFGSCGRMFPRSPGGDGLPLLVRGLITAREVRLPLPNKREMIP
jgi:hypothetical protein